MFIAEGRMRGNTGVFVNDTAEDEAEATVALRHCYQCLRTEGTQIKIARRANPEQEEDIRAIINGDYRRKYLVYRLDSGWFIEGLYLP